MVEKTPKSEHSAPVNQLELLRNILFGEFTSKYEQRIDFLEKKIEELQFSIIENSKFIEQRVDSQITKSVENLDNKVTKSVEDMDEKMVKFTNDLGIQINQRFVENRNSLSSEICKIEEEKEGKLTDFADLFVDLASRMRKL